MLVKCLEICVRRGINRDMVSWVLLEDLFDWCLACWDSAGKMWMAI